MAEFERVTKKSRRIATQKALSIIANARKTMGRKHRFDDDLVGSAAYNTTLKLAEEVYDLDFDLIITKNFLKPEDAQYVFDQFYNAIKAQESESLKVNETHSVITCEAYDLEKLIYSIDFAVLKAKDDTHYKARMNDKNKKRDWAEKGEKYNQALADFNAFGQQVKEEIITERVLPMKYNEKQKPADERKPSIISQSNVHSDTRCGS